MFDFSEDDVNQLKQAAFDIASQVNGAIADAEKQSVDRRLQQETKSIDDQAKREKKILDDKRKKGLISEKKYASEMERIDADTEKRKEEADRKAFEQKKKIDTKAAIINTALAIGKIWADVPKFDFGASTLVLTAIAAAQGAMQIATIQSQKYALGGIVPVGENQDGLSMAQVKGASHARGGLRITIGGKPVGEMEGDEILAIINKNSASKYLPQLSALNQAGGGVKFATGGIPITSTNFSIPRPAALPNYGRQAMQQNNEWWAAMQRSSDLRFEEMIDKIDKQFQTLQVVVSESEITDAQDSVRRIRARAKY